MNCRHCGSDLNLKLVDLGSAPPSNAYLTKTQLHEPEIWLPLRVMVCTTCWLAQTEDFIDAHELFRPDYAYFSSTSSVWLNHAESYAQNVIPKLGLGKDSFVIEIACNDGYLLKHFIDADIPCLGIEPTRGTANAAEKLSIPVMCEFFGERLGRELSDTGKAADLIIGNNVYAHVPDINDFTRGMKRILALSGTITLEFPHLLQMIRHCQFDTIYHEHYSYLSLHTVRRIFHQAGLRIYDVTKLDTHGGSLRIWGCHVDDERPDTPSVAQFVEEEEVAGLRRNETYSSFQHRINQIKDDFLQFLIEQKRQGKKVAAYGAAAKGNTLLNYAGVRPDLIAYVCDAALSKQGNFLPGSQIPIVSPETLERTSPDFLIILPWNLADEIIGELSFLKQAETKFVVSVPEIKIV